VNAQDKTVQQTTKGKRGPKKGEGGRKKKEVNWNIVDNLCKIQCTEIEIASALDVSIQLLNERIKEVYGKTFIEYWQEKAAGGKKSLRRKQFQLALEGDKTMLVWLGKQYLGQTDKHELAGVGGGPIKTDQRISLSKLTEEELAILEKAKGGV
jgi:hypothetical protein